MEQYRRILELAAIKQLPERIDNRSTPDFDIFRELIEGEYLKADNASNMQECAYLEPRITSKGRAYLKQESGQVVSVDQSTNFYGTVSHANIAPHSSHANQSIGLSGELTSLLDQIISALRSDISLSDIQRNELVSDVEFLRKELARSSPRENIVRNMMSTLGDIASITSFVMQITPYIPHLLR